MQLQVFSVCLALPLLFGCGAAGTTGDDGPPPEDASASHDARPGDAAPRPDAPVGSDAATAPRDGAKTNAPGNGSDGGGLADASGAIDARGDALPSCPATVYGAPDYHDAGCAPGSHCQMTGCQACGPQAFATDDGAGLVAVCSPDRYWVPEASDCFPAPGACGGVFIDALCTVPLSCPACEGQACNSASDCCDGSALCFNHHCSPPAYCHVGGESCKDGIGCCNGETCTAGTDVCPDTPLWPSCEPSENPCVRDVECCAGSCSAAGMCQP